MTDPRLAHLSYDDLDALLAGPPTPVINEHLVQCEACRTTVEADRAVVGALAALPAFAPSPRFEDNVMSRVTVRRAVRTRSIVQLPAALPSRLKVAAMAVTVIGAMGASVVWSLANRAVLASWGSQLAATFEGWLWLGLRTVTASVTALPWYTAVRDLLGSPGRLVLAMGILTAGYVAGLLALRRLVAIPSRPVPHANW